MNEVIWAVCFIVLVTILGLSGAFQEKQAPKCYIQIDNLPSEEVDCKGWK